MRKKAIKKSTNVGITALMKCWAVPSQSCGCSLFNFAKTLALIDLLFSFLPSKIKAQLNYLNVSTFQLILASSQDHCGNSENRSQIHLKNRQIVQTPFSLSTLNVFWKSHLKSTRFLLLVLFQCDQNRHCNLTSHWREKAEESVMSPIIVAIASRLLNNRTQIIARYFVWEQLITCERRL